MVDFAVTPARTTLITVDVQNYFVDIAADGRAVVDRINELTAACRRAGILVVHVRYVLLPDASNAGVMGEITPWIREGSWSPTAEGAAWHKDLVIDDRDMRLEKPRFRAFYATNLEHVLRSRGVDTVIITGIATNICCDTTAREAMQREFRVLFVSDATATGGDDDLTAAVVQRVTLRSMQLFAQVLATDELIAKIKREASPV